MPRQTRSSKKARQVKPIRLYDLNVHIRLHIYGFLKGSSISKPSLDRLEYYSPTLQRMWKDIFEDDDKPMEPYAVETAFAATLGDMEVLQYLQDIPTNKWIVSNCNIDNQAAEFLAFVNALLVWNENCKTFRWAYTMNFPMDEWVFNTSIERGLDLDFLKWLRKHNCPWSDHAFTRAVQSRKLDDLKWLRLEGCPWSERTFQFAIKSKRDFEVLLWLRIQGCPWDELLLSSAVLCNGDNVLLIQWLLREKCPCTKRAIQEALSWCNDSIVQALVDAKCKFCLEHFHHAICRRSLHVLKLLRQAECPMDSIAFCFAVRRGDMEILRWLKEQGCPWNAKVFTLAIEKGDREIIRWLYEEDCPMDKDTCKAVLIKYVLNNADNA